MPKFIGVIAILVFSGMMWLMVFSFGGFNVTPGGLLGALATLVTFWVSLEALARMRDGPMFDFYEFMVNRLRQVGALLMFILFWSVLAVMVGVSIMFQAQYFPQNFLDTNSIAALQKGTEALRMGYSISMIFGIIYLLKMPVRPTSLLKHFGFIK